MNIFETAIMNSYTAIIIMVPDKINSTAQQSTGVIPRIICKELCNQPRKWHLFQ